LYQNAITAANLPQQKQIKLSLVARNHPYQHHRSKS